jgi:hypothetical protein
MHVLIKYLALDPRQFMSLFLYTEKIALIQFFFHDSQWEILCNLHLELLLLIDP